MNERITDKGIVNLTKVTPDSVCELLSDIDFSYSDIIKDDFKIKMISIDEDKIKNDIATYSFVPNQVDVVVDMDRSDMEDGEIIL